MLVRTFICQRTVQKILYLWFWSIVASVYCAWHARHLFSSAPLGMYPVLRFLDQVVVLFWVLVVKLCSFNVAVSIHTPIISVWKVFLLKKNRVYVQGMREGVCTTVHMWRSEDDSQGLPCELLPRLNTVCLQGRGRKAPPLTEPSRLPWELPFSAALPALAAHFLIEPFSLWRGSILDRCSASPCWGVLLRVFAPVLYLFILSWKTLIPVLAYLKTEIFGFLLSSCFNPWCVPRVVLFKWTDCKDFLP